MKVFQERNFVSLKLSRHDKLLFIRSRIVGEWIRVVFLMNLSGKELYDKSNEEDGF